MTVGWIWNVKVPGAKWERIKHALDRSGKKLIG